MPDGYGFLRAHNYEGGEKDAYIAAQKIKKCGLRKGDWIKAEARKICDNRPAGVVNVLEVNGRSPETAFKRKNFDYLTPIYPDSRFRLNYQQLVAHGKYLLTDCTEKERDLIFAENAWSVYWNHRK